MEYLDREFTNDTEIFGANKRTLLIDGDLLVFSKCCVHIEDDDVDRRLITSYLRAKIPELCAAANCGSFRFFLTTKQNFRNYVSDQYKIKRKDLVRPVNLAYAKHWATLHLGAEYVPYLEADDLMSIHQNQNTVIYSWDKDLRQVPGWHLTDKTFKLEEVTELGKVWKHGSKILFNGYKGLMFQCLTGDTTDSILGCGVNLPNSKTKSGFKRKGIGPKEAMGILNSCIQTKESFTDAVLNKYREIHGMKAKEAMEKECNLLFMIKEFDKDTNLAKRWVLGKREEYMNITTGEII